MNRSFEEIIDGINKRHFPAKQGQDGRSLKSFISDKLSKHIPLEKKKLHSKSDQSSRKIVRGFSFGISDLSGDSIDQKLSILLSKVSTEYAPLKENIIKQIESDGYAFLSASFGVPPKVLSKKDMEIYTDVRLVGDELSTNNNSLQKDFSKKTNSRPKRG